MSIVEIHVGLLAPLLLILMLGKESGVDDLPSYKKLAAVTASPFLLWFLLWLATPAAEWRAEMLIDGFRHRTSEKRFRTIDGAYAHAFDLWDRRSRWGRDDDGRFAEADVRVIGSRRGLFGTSWGWTVREYPSCQAIADAGYSNFDTGRVAWGL